jgi:PAS domain S-box-containing protein
VQEAARRTGIKLQWIEAPGFNQERLDLWVLQTVRPERLKQVHLTEPYLQAESCFLVRANSPIHSRADLKHGRISYGNAAILRDTLRQLLPDAQLIAAGNSAGAVARLTDGAADAAFVDQYAVMTSLLRGAVHEPLRMLPDRSPRRPLALAATFANAAVADELRRGMQSMMNDGSVTQLVERWTFFPNPATAVIGELAREKSRVRQLALGLASLSIVIIIMVGLTVWSRHQTARLRQAENLLRHIADRVPGLVYQFRLNADGTSCFPFASEAIRQIYRVSPESVRTDATRVFAALHPDDYESVSASIQQSAGALTPWKHEYRVKFDDGTVRWLAGNALPQRERDGATLWHGFITDITERKTAEEAMQAFERKIRETQKLESLGLLAGGIAHDFNNLLTGILGNTHLASHSLTTGAPAQSYLESIKQGCIRAAGLCKQMLAYSGKGRFVVRKLSLNTLVEETTQLLRLSISKQAELRFNLAPDLPPIEADATQVHQVIMNLVINASEAIGAKGGLISLSTLLVRVSPGEPLGGLLAPELPAGAYVCLEVSDTGCGMSAETQARIFDPFFTTKFTGRGLGLAAVHGIVRGHKGALKVYSELGRGSTFKLFFPAAAGAADPIANPTARAPAAWRGHGCILVVDDEENVRQTVAAMLEKIGFTVEIAGDGREGVERFRAHPDRFTAVLMDLTMPHLDGKQAFAELRRIRPNVRVVLMSGFNEEEAAGDLAGKKLAGFLQKPFEFDALIAVLRRATGETAAET